MSEKILHSDRDLYFLCRNEPTPENEKWATVSCESEKFGKAVSAYFSPFDAMVDAIFQSDSRGPYRTVPSTSFDLSNFIADHNNKLTISFQVAWAAHQNSILLRPAGKFAACAISSCSDINEDVCEIHFPIPEMVNKLHERLLDISGIDNWQRSVDEFKSLPQLKRDEVVINAIRTIPGTCSGNNKCNQLALYDLGTEQWRFARYELIEDLLTGYKS